MVSSPDPGDTDIWQLVQALTNIGTDDDLSRRETLQPDWPNQKAGERVPNRGDA